MSDEVELPGGIAHPGEVVRAGETVRRPAGPHTPGVQALLAHLRTGGFAGVPEPLGFDERGREVLSFIDGEVPVPPYPAWSLGEDALASVGRLLRRYHEAAAGFDPAGGIWSVELADPEGGDLVVHTDVCPENVVFRDGEAVALLDFDFASPGRRLWDVACTISMWAPLKDPRTVSPERATLDPFARFGVFCGAYGVAPSERDELIAIFPELRRVGNAFVRRHVDAGEPAFVEMWEASGGEEAERRNVRWIGENLDRLRRVLDDPGPGP